MTMFSNLQALHRFVFGLNMLQGLLSQGHFGFTKWKWIIVSCSARAVHLHTH